MDITDSRLRNRWSIAIAFATMLSTTSGLFLQQKFFFIRRGDENLSNVYCMYLPSESIIRTNFWVRIVNSVTTCLVGGGYD